MTTGGYIVLGVFALLFIAAGLYIYLRPNRITDKDIDHFV